MSINWICHTKSESDLFFCIKTYLKGMFKQVWKKSLTLNQGFGAGAGSQL